MSERTAEQSADLESFIRAYVECALWSSTDEDGEPLDASYDHDAIAPEAMESIEADCAAFLETHRDVIGQQIDRAGMDFWLTRNRHGAGFWDGDWPVAVGKILSDDAHVYGSSDLYPGDDGMLYVS